VHRHSLAQRIATASKARGTARRACENAALTSHEQSNRHVSMHRCDSATKKFFADFRSRKMRRTTYATFRYSETLSTSFMICGVIAIVKLLPASMNATREQVARLIQIRPPRSVSSFSVVRRRCCNFVRMRRVDA